MKIKRINEYLFFLLYITMSIPGIGYFCVACSKREVGLWNYTDDFISAVGQIPKLITHLKDYTIILFLLVLIFTKGRKLVKEIIITILLVIYGTLLAIINNYSILVAIAGIRAYIYIFVLYLFLKYISIDKIFIKKLINLNEKLIFFQVIALIIQCAIYKFSFIPGSGGYRLVGLMTNAGTLGAFAIGSSYIISYFYLKHNLLKTSKYIIISILTIFIAICSGGRGAVLMVSVQFIIVIISKIKFNEKLKVLLIGGCSITIVPIIAKLLASSANRGTYGDSYIGRIVSWNHFFEGTVLNFLFGNGFGVGTNTAKSLGVSNMSMDSTFATIAVQFGIGGLISFIIFLIIIIERILKRTRINSIYSFYIIGSLIFGLFSGNILEMYCWIIPLFLVIYKLVTE